MQRDAGIRNGHDWRADAHGRKGDVQTARDDQLCPCDAGEETRRGCESLERAPPQIRWRERAHVPRAVHQLRRQIRHRRAGHVHEQHSVPLAIGREAELSSQEQRQTSGPRRRDARMGEHVRCEFPEPIGA